MTGWADLVPPQPMSDVDTGLAIQVLWVDANSHWAIWISKQYRNGNGTMESQEVYNGHFGRGEVETAYQALQLALSEWRNHR